jgi:hypothetical protein
MPRSYTLVALLSHTRAPVAPTVTPCAARSPLPAALRRLRLAGSHRVRVLRHRSATVGRAALRPVRCPGRLARPSLPRVRRPAGCIRVRASGGRVRGRCPPARLRVEGTRPPRSGRARGRDRGRGRPAALLPGDHVRPAGRRPQPEARSPPARAARGRARSPVGAAGRARARAGPAAAAAARPEARRAAPQRSRRVSCGAGRRARTPGRRRLHHGRDRLRGGERAPRSRGVRGRRGHFRAGGEALTSSRVKAATL